MNAFECAGNTFDKCRREDLEMRDILEPDLLSFVKFPLDLCFFDTLLF